MSLVGEPGTISMTKHDSRFVRLSLQEVRSCRLLSFSCSF